MMMAPAPMALVLLLGGCLCAASSAPPVASPPPLREGATFAEFAARYRPQGYSNSTERSHRATVFSANQLAVRRHNAAADSGNHSFWLALNEWADMTHHEWVAKMMLRPTTPPRQAAVGAPSSSPDRKGRQVPAKVDWTSPDTCKQPSGCVTSVKNQGYCGACWAFSAAGAMESAYAIANGKLVNASVQQILDCQAGANACAGGDTQDGVLYAIGNGGLASWEDYPYTSGAAQQVTPCCASPDPAHPYTCLPAKITIDAYDRVPAADEDALMEYVALSPVSVNVNASRELMQFYSYGVYDVDCSPQTDHGVLAVGYGSGGTETMAYDFSQSGRNKTDCGSWCEDCWGNPHCSGCKKWSYDDATQICTIEINMEGDWWKVKNSWGAGWGQKGYVYFSRGKHGPLGQCGIATAPSRPLATPEGDSNSSGWKPDGYDIVYDCLSIGTPVNCTQGKECKFTGCTSANTCVAEAAAFCDKLGDDCGGFAYSDNWDVLNAQFFLGGNSSDTTIGCSSDWDTWCKPGKCGPPMSWTRPYGHCEPPPPPPPPL